jgi:hypothetical protein
MDCETASLRDIDRLEKEFLDHQKQYDDMNSSSGAEVSSEMLSMTAGDSSTSVQQIQAKGKAEKEAEYNPNRDEKNDGIEQDIDEPESLLCPITREIFRDPVFVGEVGNTYERVAIESFWERLGRSKRDPLTNAELSSTSTFVNWDKRREVQRYLDAHPLHTPQGWLSREVPRPSPTSTARVVEGSWRSYLPAVILLVVITVPGLMASYNNHDQNEQTDNTRDDFNRPSAPPQQPARMDRDWPSSDGETTAKAVLLLQPLHDINRPSDGEHDRSSDGKHPGTDEEY